MNRIACSVLCLAAVALLPACAGPSPEGAERQGPAGPMAAAVEGAGTVNAEVLALQEQVAALRTQNRRLQARLEAVDDHAGPGQAELPSPIPRVARDSPGDEALWDGFRNVTWGVSLATRDDMDWDGMEGKGVYRYTRPDDLMAAGDAELSSVYYLSCDDRFCGIVVGTEGEDNFEALKGFCISRFGPADESDEQAQTWTWHGKTSDGKGVDLTLARDAKTGRGQCVVSYLPLLSAKVKPATRDIPVTGGF